MVAMQVHTLSSDMVSSSMASRRRSSVSGCPIGRAWREREREPRAGKEPRCVNELLGLGTSKIYHSAVQTNGVRSAATPSFLIMGRRITSPVLLLAVLSRCSVAASLSFTSPYPTSGRAVHSLTWVGTRVGCGKYASSRSRSVFSTSNECVFSCGNCFNIGS